MSTKPYPPREIFLRPSNLKRLFVESPEVPLPDLNMLALMHLVTANLDPNEIRQSNDSRKSMVAW